MSTASPSIPCTVASPGSPARNPEQGRYSTIGGKVQCNDLVFFFYLTDVYPWRRRAYHSPLQPQEPLRLSAVAFLSRQLYGRWIQRRVLQHRSARGSAQCNAQGRRCGHHLRIGHPRRAILGAQRPRPPLSHPALHAAARKRARRSRPFLPRGQGPTFARNLGTGRTGLPLPTSRKSSNKKSSL